MSEKIQKTKQEEEAIASKILVAYLIWSVIISVTIIILGVAEYLITGNTGYGQHPLSQLITAHGSSANAFPYYLGNIIQGITQFKSFAIIQLGVLILLLTPFGRIFLQIFIFAKEKDRAFVAIATTVFIILLISLYMVRFIA
ncbi:MAG: DUF1634 domain-containing protein [Thermoplasmata archaeon]